MTREELERIITVFLDNHTTMTLSCCLDDRPWAAAVYYARQGLDLVFFSSPTSRHSQVFAENPRAAAAVHGEYATWKEIEGLQIEGSVYRIEGTAAKASALAVYIRRFPFVREFLSDPASLGKAVAEKTGKTALYVLKPSSIRHVSNDVGFGTRRRLEVENGKAVGEARLE